VKPHTLRHSFATHLLEQNTGIRVISGASGPRQILERRRRLYAHVATDTIRTMISPPDRLILMPGKRRPLPAPGD
jgi:site-specific recombinase XerD